MAKYVKLEDVKMWLKIHSPNVIYDGSIETIDIVMATIRNSNGEREKMFEDEETFRAWRRGRDAFGNCGGRCPAWQDGYNAKEIEHDEYVDNCRELINNLSKDNDRLYGEVDELKNRLFHLSRIAQGYIKEDENE